MPEQTQETAVPELLLPVVLLVVILAAIEMALVGTTSSAQTNSYAVASAIFLGFAPWIYIGYVAGKLFALASGALKSSFVWTETACLGFTLLGEMLLSYALVDGWNVVGPPFNSSFHQSVLLVLCFGVPFLLGIPACFAFSLRLAKLIGSPRAGFMPALFLSVGLLHPFTLLGAAATMISMIGGPQQLQALGPGPLWIYSAAAGCLLATLGLDSLRTKLIQNSMR